MTSTAHKDKDGNLRWYNEQGHLHRENDPAVVWADGSKEWFMNDRRHRENGPASEWENGSYREWWINGLRHRENGPAFEGSDGTKAWYLNGQLHRENGPAIESANGDSEYYLNGETGPEIEDQVKENMARIQAQKEQQELLKVLSQDDSISAKINIFSPKTHKKL